MELASRRRDLRWKLMSFVLKMFSTPAVNSRYQGALRNVSLTEYIVLAALTSQTETSSGLIRTMRPASLINELLGNKDRMEGLSA